MYESRNCVRPLTSLTTIHIFYVTSTNFCPRPEGSESSFLKEIGSMVHLFEWNGLLIEFVCASSVNMFKNKIDKYLSRAGYS